MVKERGKKPKGIVFSEEKLIWQWQLDHRILLKTGKTHWGEKIRTTKERKKEKDC